jgi:trimethylamine--corrinoid protein Co-methyltransferase
LAHLDLNKQRRRRKNITKVSKQPKFLSYGGNLRILQKKECKNIHGAVLDILSDIGISHVSSKTQEIAVNNGIKFKNGRLYFPKALVEDTISALSRSIILHGQKSENDLQITGNEIYFGTGGATPTILDHKTDKFRETTLKDLYENACLIENLENVDFFSRTVIARDLKIQRDLDLNTAFACLRGTTKHIMTSISQAEDIKSIREMVEDICALNSKNKQKNLISLNTNHIVSPLRFDPESCDVLIEGVKSGLPINVNTFAQVGASTAVTLAGAIAQTIAETMAGMILGYLVDKNASINIWSKTNDN